MNKKEQESATEKIFKHLKNHGVYDKDARSDSPSPQKKKKTCRIVKKEIRYTLDLHGLKSDEARRGVRITLNSCRERGIKEILIIHGKGYHSDVNGGPVLKGVVYQMLEHEYHHLIRNFRPAPRKDGGDGATLVYLK